MGDLSGVLLCFLLFFSFPQNPASEGECLLQGNGDRGGGETLMPNFFCFLLVHKNSTWLQQCSLTRGGRLNGSK